MFLLLLLYVFFVDKSKTSIPESHQTNLSRLCTHGHKFYLFIQCFLHTYMQKHPLEQHYDHNRSC